MLCKEKKLWTEYEDKKLKELREIRCLKKWSDISKILEEEFQIKGKNGKKCRERYQTHLNSSINREDWSEEEQLLLLKLHNDKGNKWVEIAKELKRSDNAVKNHYHSKLRRSLRRINKQISDSFRSEFKPLKPSLISKIVQTAEQYHSNTQNQRSSLSILSYCLKNKILNFVQPEQTSSEVQSAQKHQPLLDLMRDVNLFNKNYKNKGKKSRRVGNVRNIRNSGPKAEGITNGKYKGKQILNLISQNQRIRTKKSTFQQIKEEQDNDSQAQRIQQIAEIQKVEKQQLNIQPHSLINLNFQCSQPQTFALPSASLIFNPTYFQPSFFYCANNYFPYQMLSSNMYIPLSNVEEMHIPDYARTREEWNADGAQ